MNKDDVIRMATEAGFLEPGYIHGNTVIAELERFAALVAAAERRKHQADIEAWKSQAAMAEKWRGMAHARHGDGQKVVQEIRREAAAYEREACAQLCEQSERVNNGYFAQKIREMGE